VSYPTPPSGDAIDAPPTIFEYPPQLPGINTSSAPSNAQITTPTFPATTVAVTNTTGVDVVAYILNGSAAMTVVKVNGTTTGLAPIATTGNATVYLPAGATFSATYASGTPTWVWMAV
jgi:hypothetical protein